MIVFKKLKIQSFKSISDIELDFDDIKGNLYSLEGINNTVKFASSNGAGKSTIWDSLSFVLYGVVNGIYVKKEEFQNKNTKIPLKVTLDFDIDCGDNQGNYKIIRTLNNTFLYKNDEDITELAKTETEKKLAKILNLTKEEFFSFTYLTQNSSGNFLGKTPSEKLNIIKDFIFGEELLNIKSKIDNLLKSLKSEQSNIKNEISNIEGKISGLSSIQNINKEEIWEESDLTNKLDELKIFDDVKEKCNEYNKEYKINLNKFNNIKLQLEDIKSKLYIAKNKICPTCKQHLQDLSVEDELKKQAINLKNEGVKLRETTIDYKSKVENILTKYPFNIDEMINKLRDEIAEQKAKRKNYYEYQQVFSILNESSDKLDKLHNNYDKLDIQIKELVSLQKFFNTTFIQNVQKTFLNEIEQYLNLYCYEVFEESFKLEFSNNNLELFIGNRPYSFFSGGERQRINFLFVFAIKVALLNLTDKNTNLLIFDESLSGSDSEAYSNSIDIINRLSNSIGLTTIIVSHRDNINTSSNKIIITRNYNNTTKLEIVTY